MESRYGITSDFNFIPNEPMGLYHPELEKDSCGVGVLFSKKANNKLLEHADRILVNMSHRGAELCDNSGDGAGVCTAVPHELFQAEVGDLFELPGRHEYGVGNVMFPKDKSLHARVEKLFEEVCDRNDLSCLGFRYLPINKEACGVTALRALPPLRQVFVSRKDRGVRFPKNGSVEEQAQFVASLNAKLYIARRQWCVEVGNMFKEEMERRLEEAVSAQQKKAVLQSRPGFYVCSLSASLIVYKGQLTCSQLFEFFLDLRNPSYLTNFSMVHSRFSTNTFPSWERAQPNRILCHNGEINTLRGNKAWMKAREGALSSSLLGPDLSSTLPAIEPGGSDSMALDNVLELMLNSGYSLPQAMMLLVPEAWENLKGGEGGLSEEVRAFHQYFAGMMEPWDGPANLAFTDGFRFLGGKLDRNGLRPSRFYVLEDGTVVLGSEVGMMHSLDDSLITRKGRIGPGELFLIDMKEGKIIESDEIKQKIAEERPYAEWVQKSISHFPDSLPEGVVLEDHYTMDVNSEEFINQTRYYLTLGMYTVEQIELILNPMASQGQEGLGSMGNDQCLAVLSDNPRLLFDYFKQLFAQVTNPPIDPIREEIVMSLNSFLGSGGNLLNPGPDSCKFIETKNPILSPEQFAFLNHKESGFNVVTIDATFGGGESLEEALKRVCAEAMDAIQTKNANLIVLSDAVHLRDATQTRLPIPSLMALSTTHHHLGIHRARASLIVSFAEVREIHHFCVLFGFGADAVYPYGVYRLLRVMGSETKAGKEAPGGGLAGVGFEAAVENYRKSAGKGIRKVMAKMGISTLQGYRGSQIFEIIGFSKEMTDFCFKESVTRIGGIGFDEIENDVVRAHERSLSFIASKEDMPLWLPSQGHYMWRKKDIGGDSHVMSPKMIAELQKVARDGGQKNFENYRKEVNSLTRASCVRGMLRFRYEQCEPIPLEDVEPATEIVKRFCTGAMSYGSISAEAHTTLAKAMNKLGGKSNTGEGGEDESRRSWNLKEDEKDKNSGKNKRSAIKQIASGRFGVTIGYLADAEELQIKVAQGAKPGEGGELPGHKVSATIAKVRHSTPGVGLISPPPHHDIYSIEDLKQLIFDLKNVNPKARVSVKLVSEVGVGIIAAGVAKAGADHILISGQDGGTGAAKLTSIKHAGQVWELGLAETQQTLVMNRLREDVVVQADGGMRTGRDVVSACLLGAEEFGFGTAPLIALGCIMMRKCHLNTCPVGIATQDPVLREKFEGKPEHLINFFFALAEDVRGYMARLGFKSIKEMVGRADLLDTREHIPNRWGIKKRIFNLTPLTFNPHRFVSKNSEQAFHFVGELRDRGLDDVIDQQLVKEATPLLTAVEKNELAKFQQKELEFGPIKICSIDRTVGTLLSYYVAQACGDDGLPDSAPTLKYLFTGSAGQSFAAWLAKGVKMVLSGDANDFVAKGLSGGKVVLSPPKTSKGYAPAENMIAGNVGLYGAISGTAFFHGLVADRFAVRNSGATGVCEGVGDHACEYMTGGRIVILGDVGRNFAAGMSGGVVWIYRPSSSLTSYIKNIPTLLTSELASSKGSPDHFDQEFWAILKEYAEETDSKAALNILNNPESEAKNILRVVPRDYSIQIGKMMKEKEQEQQEEKKAEELTPEQKEEEEKAKEEEKTKEGEALGQLEGEDLSQIYKKQQAGEGGKGGGLVDIEDLGIEPGLPANKLKGFMKFSRKAEGYRKVEERVDDWDEIWKPHETDGKRFVQATRCMDCGVPTCHSEYGCPVDNKIPEFNTLVANDQWKLAYDKLSETNPFPEFTGRVCPAPCEGACVLSIVDKSVTIKNIENSIIERAFANGWVRSTPIIRKTEYKVAIIGSGPAGLAVADGLSKMGHAVSVFERDNAIGGLLRYGIPNVKLDKKAVVERRLSLMRENGVEFFPKTNVDFEMMESLKSSYSAVVVCAGATKPRDLPIPGRDGPQVHFAMEFLHSAQTALDNGHPESSRLTAEGKNVIVIGAGDTGCDCIATSVRQKCASVTNFSLMFQAPKKRGKGNEWPAWPNVYRVEYGHQEAHHHQGRDPRAYCILTKGFVRDEEGKLVGVETVEVKWTRKPGVWTRAGLSWEEVPESKKIWPCDLALIAIGYQGAEVENEGRGQPTALGLKVTQGKMVTSSYSNFSYHSSGNVFVAGDCRRGQSLVVWAIKEGREAAKEVDQFLHQERQFLPLH